MRVTQLPAGGGAPVRRNSPTAPRRTSPIQVNNGINIKEILSRFEKDDYILAGLILVLVLEGCDDYILLAALGYLFVMGLKE